MYSVKDAIKYVLKQDEVALQFNMDAEAEQKARTDKRKILGKRLLDGEALHALTDENPELLFEFAKIEQNLAAYKRAKKEDKPDLKDSVPNPWGLEMPWKPKEKKKHYWIWSEGPNVGKTTKFLMPLKEQHRAQFMNQDEKYQQFPTKTEVVMIDEYNGGLRVQQLNQMCDGTYQYPVKNGCPQQLETPLIVICSNRSISQVYPNAKEFVLARFNEIKVDQYRQPDISVSDQDQRE